MWQAVSGFGEGGRIVTFNSSTLCPAESYS